MNIALLDCVEDAHPGNECYVIAKLGDPSHQLLKVKGLEHSHATLAFPNYKDANLFITTFIPILGHQIKVVPTTVLPQGLEAVQLFSWKKAYATRCQDCACLAQDSRGMTVCDEAGQAISAVVCCPEGLSLELTYGRDMTF